MNRFKGFFTLLKEDILKQPFTYFWLLLAFVYAFSGEAGAMIGCLVLSKLSESEE